MSDLEPSEPVAAAPTCTFFKKSGKNKNRGNVRKRHQPDNDNGDDGEGDETSAVVIREKKSKFRNPMIQKSGTVKRKKDMICDEGSDQEPDEMYTSYKSTKSGKMAGPEDMGATATVEIDTALDRDEQAVFERGQAINKELKGEGL